ncbi:TetR/AcrR family transcriptional regulator [Actinomycetospora callitridis]|uniref:TetR/AcrR family transcriptional regulator n=1 Tax=Actinomycetospora callitridis TaxID=913944 RepID=UPI0023669280|nr:TetR/AcrR family transcriptional regulator [Actinomycetospora callitridis]MDD7920274.1 TetR/AcrR family transcriptional regulator [Actinomycetospora callitridis]
MTTRKYEQRLRAESAEQTRRDVLAALENRLREAPGASVSIEDVARRAGVSRSTVYLVFGSRAGLFDALADDLWDRSGLPRLTEAVAHADAREHLRGGLRTGAEIFAAMRDVAAVLYRMSALDPEAVGGSIARKEEHRWGGMLHLATRLGEQDVLRPDVTVDEAAETLWVLASFESFDALYTGRGLPADEVARVLIAMAERTLCR